MQEFKFTLKFALSQPESETEQFIEKLAHAGCKDAVTGAGQKGIVSLAFSRSSVTAYKAVMSAINDVKSAVPEAELIEAAPDYVGLTEVADFMGFSRQNLRKLMLTHSETFPIPVHSGKYSLWHLYGVLQWLEQRQRKHIDPTVKEVAFANMQINVARQIMTLDLHTQDSRKKPG